MTQPPFYKRFRPLGWGILLSALILGTVLQQGWCRKEPTPVFLSTDLSRGGVDLAAVAVLLRSKDLEPAGIATARSTTKWREKTLSHWLSVCGRGDLPVFAGGTAPDEEGDYLPGFPAMGASLETTPPAVDRLISLANAKPDKLEVIVLGTPLIVGEAILQDASVAHHLAGVHWVPGPESDSLSAEEITAAKAFWESPVKMTLYGTESSMVPSVSAEWAESLGRHHSELTDHLTRTFAYADNRQLARGGALEFTPLLPLSEMLGWRAVAISEQAWGLTEEGRPASVPSSGRNVWTVTTLRDRILLDEVQDTLTSIQRDFTILFTKFLFGLSRLSPESREIVQERLKSQNEEEEEKEAQSPRDQILDFVEDKLEALAELEDPQAATVRGDLKKAHRTLAGMGWHFPKSFYSQWSISPGGKETVDFSFGVANQSNRKLTQVRAGIRGPDFERYQELASATGEAVFDFTDLPATNGDWVLSIDWTAAGFPSSQTTSIPVESP